MTTNTTAAPVTHGFRGDVDSDRPDFCQCGAGFWDGYNLGAVKRAHLAAHGIDVDSAPAVGEIVRFREDTPQHPANRTIRFRVVPAPDGSPFGIDNTHPDNLGLVYVWLEDVRGADKSPSRRRVRTGYAASLEAAPRPLLEVLADHVAEVTARRIAEARS